MAASGCDGQAVCGDGGGCGECRTVLEHGTAYSVAGIPVRRFGIVPPPPEPEWEIEAAEAHGPHTIAEYGGTTVLLAGLIAAVVAGCLLYLL